MNNIGNCSDCTTCGECQPEESVDIPPLFCMHCQPSQAPCIKVCKQNAFFELGGAISLNYDQCNRCRECIDVCPIKIIKIP